MNKTAIHWATSGALIALLGQGVSCAAPPVDENPGEAPAADDGDSCADWGTPGHLAAAAYFVDHVPDAPYILDNPDSNAFTPPGTVGASIINWTPGHVTGTTTGASLFTLSLQHSDPTITKQLLTTWYYSTSPNSYLYYNAINSGVHFSKVTNISDLRPGDLFSIWYASGRSSGHTAIVEGCPAAITSITPVIAGTTQYTIGVIDSTSAAHGCTVGLATSDTRWVPADPAHPCAAGTNDGGAGRATMRIYADSATGELRGYAWSLSLSAVYYPNDLNAYPPTATDPRLLNVGRFVR